MKKKDFKKVNQKRKDKEYVEHEAAIYLNGSARKPELKQNLAARIQS